MRSHVLGNLLVDVFVAEHLDASDPSRPRVAERLEARDEAQRAPRPQALAALVRSLYNRICPTVAVRI